MHDRMVAGIRWAITWLHKRADQMNDPHARQVLNDAAFNLGNDLRAIRARKAKESDSGH